MYVRSYICVYINHKPTYFSFANILCVIVVAVFKNPFSFLLIFLLFYLFPYRVISKNIRLVSLALPIATTLLVKLKACALGHTTNSPKHTLLHECE